jgi:hypothetical protein
MCVRVHAEEAQGRRCLPFALDLTWYAAGKPGVGAACLTDTHLELLLKSPFLPGPNAVCRGRPGRSTVPSEPAARAAHSNSLSFLGLMW